MDGFDYTTAGDLRFATFVANDFVMLICKDGDLYSAHRCSASEDEAVWRDYEMTSIS